MLQQLAGILAILGSSTPIVPVLVGIGTVIVLLSLVEIGRG